MTESPTTVVKECIDELIETSINKCNVINEQLQLDLAEQRQLEKAKWNDLLKSTSLILDEAVDIDRAKYILENYTLHTDAQRDKGGKNKDDYKSTHTKVMNYCKQKVMSPNSKVTYSAKPDGINIQDGGRLYADSGIQYIPADVRNFIIPPRSVDLDIANCFPMILNTLAKKRKVICGELDSYCNNRTEYLSELQNELEISRDAAKGAILAILFQNPNNLMDKSYRSSIKLKRIKEDVIQIHNKFKYHYSAIYKNALLHKSDNPCGSALSRICHQEENKMLLKIMECCYIKQYKVFALMFDGIVITPPTEGFNEANFISEIQTEIKTLGFEVEIKSKAIGTRFKLPDDYIAYEYNSYDEVKRVFELTNCKVDCVFWNVDVVAQSSKQYDKARFKVKHEHIRHFCTMQNKQMVFIDKWLADPDLRRYDDTDIYPKQELCPPNVFNLWVPFAASNHTITDASYATEGLDFFRDHLMVMAGNDAKVFDFLELWIAQALQYPEDKSVEIIFFSSEGTGKGLFLEFLKTILGRNKVFECTDPQNQIFGRFNAPMQQAFIVCMNETNKSYFFNNADRKKALVSDPVIVIEGKGKDSFTCNSYHRLLQFTNNPDPCAPSERRNCFIEVSGEKINDTAYFNKGFLFTKELDVATAIYDYYMQLPTKKKINKEDIPMTEYYQDVLEANKDKGLCWLEEYSQENTSELFVPTVELTNLYNKWLVANNFKHDIDSRRMGTMIKRLLGIAGTNCRRYVGGIKASGWLINFPALQLRLQVSK